jgi:NADH:ubiquinone reductase (H+-translocating)
MGFAHEREAATSDQDATSPCDSATSTPKRPRVVVVGAGFAGLAAVRALRGSGADITLVDARIYSTFQPLLYQVATGGLNPGDVAYSVRRFTRRHRASFCRGMVTDIRDQHVLLDDGRRLDYDYLVIAAGVVANHFGVPGAREHSLALYTRTEAVLLRDRLATRLEQLAARQTADDFTVLIVGGGPTGVETAGSLAELRDAAPESGFAELEPRRIHIVLVERGADLLASYHPRLRQYTRDQLRRRGVEVRVNTAIRELTDGAARLVDGSVIRADLTIWAAGVTAADVVSRWALPQGYGGRIEVERDLSVAGRRRVFVAGDLAVDSAAPLPQLASPAIQTGRHAGRQIARLIAGKRTRRFRYLDKGTMATIGRAAAIAELPAGIRLTGPIGWLSWIALHLTMLLGNRNRLSTMLNLCWRYLARPPGSAVVVAETSEPNGSALRPTDDAQRRDEVEREPASLS